MSKSTHIPGQVSNALEDLCIACPPKSRNGQTTGAQSKFVPMGILLVNLHALGQTEAAIFASKQ
eukprot:73023-Amphidinium_carterae.1